MRDDMICLKCNHKWKKRVGNPERCPMCISKKVEPYTNSKEEPIEIGEELPD